MKTPIHIPITSMQRFSQFSLPFPGSGAPRSRKAIELGWEISFPPWSNDCKDAADAVNKYGKLLTLASIVKFASDNKIKNQVRAKML